MNTPNLIVIVSAVEATAIRNTFPNHLIIGDAQIFEYLNGTTFNGIKYGLDTVEQLCDAFIANSADKQLIIHTFNPLIQNYLMCYKERKSLKESLIDDLGATSERFLVWKACGDSGLFISALDIDTVKRKLDALCIGDAIADTYLEREIAGLVVDSLK